MDDEVRHGGPEKVRAAAIVAAARLFAEKGIHGVSVREIAREVGVSHTLLHLYFGSKDEILRHVFAHYDDALEDGVKQGGDPVEACMNAYEGLFAEPNLTRTLAAALLEGVIPGKIEMHPTGQIALAERLKAMDLDGLDPRIATAALASMAIGWAVAAPWIFAELGVTDLSESEVKEQVGKVVARVLKAHGAE